jgi:hypothetical protein
MPHHKKITVSCLVGHSEGIIEGVFILRGGNHNFFIIVG